jgi:hypothetical protein
MAPAAMTSTARTLAAAAGQPDTSKPRYHVGLPDFDGAPRPALALWKTVPSGER